MSTIFFVVLQEGNKKKLKRKSKIPCRIKSQGTSLNMPLIEFLCIEQNKKKLTIILNNTEGIRFSETNSMGAGGSHADGSLTQ